MSESSQPSQPWVRGPLLSVVDLWLTGLQGLNLPSKKQSTLEYHGYTAKMSGLLLMVVMAMMAMMAIIHNIINNSISVIGLVGLLM